MIHFPFFRIAAAFIGFFGICAAAPVHAVKLISDEEARLPAAAPMLTRGITRGPTVRQIQPDPAAGPVKSPIALKIAFEARGGARIDPASVRMTYLRTTPVDLSERVRNSISDRGLELADAEVPPGEHEILLTLQDTEGRKSSQTIRLKVAK
jgi:hypothetical protein